MNSIYINGPFDGQPTENLLDPDLEWVTFSNVPGATYRRVDYTLESEGRKETRQFYIHEALTDEAGAGLAQQVWSYGRLVETPDDPDGWQYVDVVLPSPTGGQIVRRFLATNDGYIAIRNPDGSVQRRNIRVSIDKSYLDRDKLTDMQHVIEKGFAPHSPPGRADLMLQLGLIGVMPIPGTSNDGFSPAMHHEKGPYFLTEYGETELRRLTKPI